MTPSHRLIHRIREMGFGMPSNSRIVTTHRSHNQAESGAASWNLMADGNVIISSDETVTALLRQMRLYIFHRDGEYWIDGWVARRVNRWAPRRDGARE